MMENGVNLEYAKIIDNNSRAVHAVIIYTLWKLIWDQEIEIASRKGQSVPDSWGVELGGKLSNDPEKILHGGGLLPLGGSEISGGYKGYGLAAMVEIFCGILGGAHWGPNIRKWMSSSQDADLGQCFIAVDPEAFAPEFARRLQDFIDTMRNLPQAEEEKLVEVAGDMERKHEQLIDQLGGIPYHANQIEFADDIASKLQIDKLVIFKEY